MSLKKYSKIFSLDFELYNTKHYWSICWAGAVAADDKFNKISEFDIIINPGLKEKFVGNDMTFPFSNKDLKAYNMFNAYYVRIFDFLNGDTLVIGHAFENDLKMLIDVCHKFSLKLPGFDYVDTNIIYNAVKGDKGEHSLKSLGDTFGIEFLAHDPKEDAKAAFEIAKNCIGDLSVEDFLEKYEISAGSFKNGVIKKCRYNGMSENQKAKIDRFNKIFDIVQKCGQGEGKKYYIDGIICSEQDVSGLAQKLLNEGYGLASSNYSADTVITNNLSLKLEEKFVSLKSILKKFDIPFSGFDFTPAKIRDENSKPISLTEYYGRAFLQYQKSGFLDGKKISFSKSAERKSEYEDAIKALIGEGGTVYPRVEETDFFIVEKLSDLKKDYSDGRIRAYKMSKKPKALDFDSFLKALQEKRI